MISIKCIFKRKSWSKFLLIDIKPFHYSPSSSKLSMKPIFNKLSKRNSPFTTLRNMIMNLVLRKDHLFMMKLMNLLSSNLLGIHNVRIHLHASKHQVLLHLKLTQKLFLGNIIFLQNLSVKMLTSCILFYQVSNQQEPHLENFQKHLSNLKSTHLTMIQGRNSSSTFPFLFFWVWKSPKRKSPTF